LEDIVANYDFDIGVIGGGSGGLTVAAGASQFGAKTLLVEKRVNWGETVSILAAFPVKP